MMMEILQWLGTVGIIVGAWFYVKKPFFAAGVTALGCVSVLIWCLLLEPVALGVAVLEVVVIVLSLRNMWLAR